MANIKAWLALVVTMGATSGAALAIPVTSQSAQSEGVVETIALVCNDWGQCWQTAPYYGGGYYRGYGGYGGYRGYGGYDGYRGYGGGWGGGWGHRDWDGRDWHGGRWGDND